MAKFPQLILFGLTILTFAACASAEKPVLPQYDSVAPASAEKKDTGALAQSPETTQTVSLAQVDKTQNAATSARKIIRNGNLTLETAAPEETSRRIAQIAESKNGFVVTSDTKTISSASSSAEKQVDLTLRVPAAQFETALAEVRQTATRVTAEKVSGNDVTEEFIDLDAHINTQRALEAQFLEIMKSARTVTDALEVQRQLATVRGEIERLEGRRNFLENQTSLSTITVRLQTPAVFAAGSSGFVSRLAKALSDGIDAALAVVLFLITAFLALLPILILLGVPLYLLFCYLRRRIQRRKLAQELANQESNA